MPGYYYETVLKIDLICMGSFVVVLLVALFLLRRYCKKNCCLCMGHRGMTSTEGGGGQATHQEGDHGTATVTRLSRLRSEEGAVLIQDSESDSDDDDEVVITITS